MVIREVGSRRESLLWGLDGTSRDRSWSFGAHRSVRALGQGHFDVVRYLLCPSSKFSLFSLPHQPYILPFKCQLYQIPPKYTSALSVAATA